MRIGTKSLLFGVHQFILHPITVAISYYRIYGFPLDPRLWVAFLVHDWGYFRCEDMDGPGGREHPQLAYHIMKVLFGHDWGQWTRCHSREYCKNHGLVPSTLCVADKMAITVLPTNVYLAIASLTGELDEYMKSSNGRFGNTPAEWLNGLKEYMRKWCLENADKALRHPGI
jgi:hypothetical protein